MGNSIQPPPRIRRTHQHACVPNSYRINSYQVGAWVERQRRLFRDGKLDLDRKERLEALPGWTWDPSTDKWDEGFRYLRDYIKKNGNARVPSTHVTDDGYALGRWVTKQRRRYASDELEVDRQYRLLKLPGWAWKARRA
ncbi:helicase associated domain-containing protein [Nocardia sp. NPDC023852]|uniref:helicase associated domain-containing protein n=1 Tax=Nocardia sp. NPDC023852 TaxID=3154697 RepID=UPI0033D9FD8C